MSFVKNCRALFSDHGQLEFDPAWAGLRGDARFVKIVDGLQPNSARR